MACTKEQRDKHSLCGARKKNGETCRKYAGEGTEHRGVGTCKYHLGRSKQHNTHAVRVEAAAQMNKLDFGTAVDVDPAEALLAVVHLSFGHLCWLKSEIAGYEDKSVFDAQVLMRTFDDERDRVARISKAALDAGVADRSIKLAERWGELLAKLLQGIFADPEIAMSAHQHELLPAVLRRHLIAVDSRSEPVNRLELKAAS